MSPSYYQRTALAFAGSGGTAVAVQDLGGGSAQILIGTPTQLGWISASGNYAMAVTDSGVCMTASGLAVLPAARPPSLRYGVKVLAPSGGVTISTGGSGLIDAGAQVNASSMVLNTPGTAVDFAPAPNATDWIIV